MIEQLSYRELRKMFPICFRCPLVSLRRFLFSSVQRHLMKPLSLNLCVSGLARGLRFFLFSELLAVRKLSLQVPAWKFGQRQWVASARVPETSFALPALAPMR